MNWPKEWAERDSRSPVSLVSITPDAEKTMGYIARVSNPKGQDNEDVSRLLAYCLKNKHWSVFEHASMTLEINTTRAISPQILRHRSATFAEYSLRYSESSLLGPIPEPEMRRQDTKNRQNSTADLSQEVREEASIIVRSAILRAEQAYIELLKLGIAKECARAILPMCTPTRLYMTNNIRNWIHYIELRSWNGTQKEHRDIALGCKEIFIKELPTVSKALGWLDSPEVSV